MYTLLLSVRIFQFLKIGIVLKSILSHYSQINVLWVRPLWLSVLQLCYVCIIFRTGLCLELH